MLLSPRNGLFWFLVLNSADSSKLALRIERAQAQPVRLILVRSHCHHLISTRLMINGGPSCQAA